MQNTMVVVGVRMAAGEKIEGLRLTGKNEKGNNFLPPPPPLNVHSLPPTASGYNGKKWEAGGPVREIDRKAQYIPLQTKNEKIQL